MGRLSSLLGPVGPGVRAGRDVSRLDQFRPDGVEGWRWPGGVVGLARVVPLASLMLDMIFSKAVKRLLMDGGQCGSRGYPPNLR